MTFSNRLAVIFLFFVSCTASAQNFDIDWLKSINEKETGFKNSFFDVTSKSVTIVNIAAPLSVFAAGLIKHDKKLQKDALFIVGGYALSTIITQGSKRIIQRDRPFTTYPFIVKRSEGGGYSMPSGHVSAAFNSATALSLWFPKWYVIVPSYAWAGLVGYGRMYEGVHYPTDVLAGAVVGAGTAWLAYKAEKWFDKKNTKKKPADAPSL